MKLTALALVLLTAIATMGQQAPPQGHPLLPTLAACHAAREFLADQMPLQFRDLSVSEIQKFKGAMGGCSMVDKGNMHDYEALNMLLYKQVRDRMLLFVENSGLWDSFLSWDLDPANRQ